MSVVILVYLFSRTTFSHNGDDGLTEINNCYPKRVSTHIVI